MKRFIIAASLLVATAAVAQQPAAPAAPDPSRVAVAVINGEVVSQAKLDALYANLSPQMRAQYDRNGGKGAFLENYLRKRLLIQEAMKSGFDAKPEIQLAMEAARDSALFDRYIRDVVASQIVTDADLKKYYEEHTADFVTPEQRKVRHIIIVTTGANAVPKEEAKKRMEEIRQKLLASVAGAGEADPQAKAQVALSFFKNAAQQYSQDGTAPNGGDLGWVSKGSLDASFEKAAWGLEPGKISDVVESSFGYHLIFVEGQKPAGTQPFEAVRADIKDKLLAGKTPEIMNAVSQLTNQLRTAGKISVSPENIR